MELISLDEAIAMLEDMEGRRDEDGYIRIYKCDVIDNLRSLSSIDIVQCRECIHRDYICDDYCYEHERNIKDNDFCSYGERRK